VKGEGATLATLPLIQQERLQPEGRTSAVMCLCNRDIIYYFRKK